MSGVRRRWPLVFVVAVLLGFALVGMFWREAAVSVLAAGAERSFSASYARDTRTRMIKADVDWAIDFGGRRGLRRLDRLAMESSLAPEGREKAREIGDLIRRGDHIPYADDLARHSPWVRRLLLRKIAEDDRRD
jgi:hypothetical protein